MSEDRIKAIDKHIEQLRAEKQDLIARELAERVREAVKRLDIEHRYYAPDTVRYSDLSSDTSTYAAKAYHALEALLNNIEQHQIKEIPF